MNPMVFWPFMMAAFCLGVIVGRLAERSRRRVE
jgi:hypothetical protein